MRAALLGEFRGGSGESLVTLARYAANDHDVRLFGYPTDSPLVPGNAHAIDVRFDRQVLFQTEINRVLRAIEVYGTLRSAVVAFDPDIIFSQLETSFAGARLGKRLNVPHLVFLHDTSLLPELSWGDVDSAGSFLRAGSTSIKKRLDDYVLRNADHVIANSRDTAASHREAWDIDPEVIYPFIDVEEYRVERRGEKILHVNPSLHKGIDVTYEVAQRMPDEEFIVAGTPTTNSEEMAANIGDLPNVDMRGYVDDMRDVYRESKLVIMPSKAETFGRVPIEAGISGIPTVGSDTGGLPEAVGSDDLVVEGFDPEQYVEGIRTIERDHERYGNVARENAREKSAASQYEALRELLRTTHS